MDVLIIALISALLNLSICVNYTCYKNDTQDINNDIFLYKKSLLISSLTVFILTILYLDLFKIKNQN